MTGERAPKPLQSPNYIPQHLKPGETMPTLPTAEVIARYPARRRPDGTPLISPVTRLQHRSQLAGELPSHVLSDHTLLEVVPERLWSYPALGRTKDATNSPSLVLRGRQEREQEGLRWFLYREEHREEARETNIRQLTAYQEYADSVDPRSPEGTAIAIAKLVNGVADGDPEQVGNLLQLLKHAAGKVNPLLLGTLTTLGTGVTIEAPKVLRLPKLPVVSIPGIPALREVAVLTDNVPDTPATESAAMGIIQKSLRAGRDAVVAGQPDRVMHERELLAHPKDHQAEIATRKAVKIAAGLAPYAITYGAAVVLPPVEGPVARLAESFIGKKVIDALKGKSTEIVDIIGSIISDRLHGSTTHTREAIAVMALILDIAGVNVDSIKDTLDAHMYAQWGLSHTEEFITINEPVVLHQPYVEALKRDNQTMGEIMHGRFNKARRLAGVK